jgi:hypothetical protein
MLSRSEVEESEDNLLGYLSERSAVKPHLLYLIGFQSLPSPGDDSNEASRATEVAHVWAA